MRASPATRLCLARVLGDPSTRLHGPGWHDARSLGPSRLDVLPAPPPSPALPHPTPHPPSHPPPCSKLSQHARSKSVDNLGLAAEQARELPAAAGPVREQEQAHAHLRARSCSPAELGQGAERSPGQAIATAAVALAGDGSGQRGRLASSSGQLRPPRPPLSQQSATQPESQGERGQQQTSGQAAPRTSPQQLHGQEAQQQRQQQERSPFDVFNVASAVAAVLMPKQPSQQQQQQTTTTGPTLRHQGASDEAAEGEAWESVDVSDASVALTQRDFSFAHLIAPLANQAGLSSVTPRTTSSSSASGRGHATFVGRAFAKVRVR